ncbi:succinyldiaminopimelate transaminase [Inmirania thermothiophila]|uniref:Succinyldiaminopimelate aminotransferase n=1 Tax=Inmirania thermothiophila TaxID=1750597 RepID=A0A3N1Y065_9GAMM|nr:succinyldiaminopimelate transaminase [Inmirania thermothiophila]ROR32210.1 succinyldiaminopimelate aminotransferase [Inmirania thermothiophila]
MNPDLDRLHPYPFERLRALLAGCAPPAGLPPLDLAIGEPRHPPPPFVLEALGAALEGLGRYPATRGEAPLRQAIAAWLERRFGLPAGAVDPETHVLPVNGTREALFAFAQAVVDRTARPLVAMPNPFYQIYEGAALLAGAEPYYLDATEASGHLPDLDAVPEPVWRRCQLLYLCSPANPAGAVADAAYLHRALELAERHDFVIAADECYSEIYLDEDRPPPGLLQAAHAAGNEAFRRCVVFHSLSKRSNLPGLRSGFVAGDAEILARFLRYRTYHGCAMPPPVQAASLAAWGDEAHVAANRAAYRAKFDAVLAELAPVLPLERPPAGFYLWPRVGDDEAFVRRLYARYNVRLLPGRYLSRETAAGNPGAGRVRIALVGTREACLEAARRIRACLAEGR